MPTNAAAARVQSLEASGIAKVASQRGATARQHDDAYLAARLEAWYRLGLEAVPLAKSVGKLRIDDLHDPLALLGWLERAREMRAQQDSGTCETVTLKTGSWQLFEEKLPAGKVVFRKDINGDGKQDEFIYGPDTCVNVVTEGRIVGKTDSIGSLFGQTIAGDTGDITHVALTEFVRVKDVKRVNPERLNIIVEVRESEELGGVLVGSYLREREMLLDVASQVRFPSAVIEIPHSQRVGALKNVPLEGKVEAPAGIAKSNILLNNKEVWNIPEGLEINSLTLDLSLNLNPGPNELRVNVWDKAGNEFIKRIRLLAPPSSQVVANRAVIIGVDNVGVQSATKVREQLLKRGYIVRTLRGNKATADNIAKAMDNLSLLCRNGDRVLIYFAGEGDWNGKEKVWLTAGSSAQGTGADRPLTADNWRQWQRELSAYRTLYVFDTAATPALIESKQAGCEDMRLIRSLSGINNVVITSGNPQQRVGMSSELNRLLVRAWRDSTKVDVFDLAERVYEQLCPIREDSLPLSAGY